VDLTNDFRVGVPVEEAWTVLTDVERIAPCMPGAQLQEIEGDEYRGIVKVKVGPITAQYKGAARFIERDETAHRAVLRAEGRDTRGQGNANATITAELEADGDGTNVTVKTDLTITGRVAQFGRGVLADVSSKLLGQFVTCLETTLLAGSPAGDAGSASGGNGGSTEAGGGGAGGGDGGATASATAGGATATAAPSGAHASDIASEGAAATQASDLDGDKVTWPGPSASTKASSSAASDDRARANGTSGPAVRVIDSAEPEPVDLLEAAGAPVAKRLAPAVIGLTVLWLLSIFIRRRRRR
jgi:carbon monoxide dehydrogenase subunit G